jgi:enterochelin esterase-like enzyme
LDGQEETVVDFTVNSSWLGEDRLVSVFLPPGHRSETIYPVFYCTDGQSLPAFADGLAIAMRQGHTPPAVIVGVHSDPDYRNREYLLGLDARRFAGHESFFTDEVYRWSHAQFALDTAPRFCGVFGFSCGAAFALAVGTRHREQYGNVIAFSVAGGVERVVQSDYAPHRPPRFYLSAGNKELSFRETSQAIADVLAARGIPHKYTERSAGHDPAFWAAELPEAIRWCYSTQGID